MKKAIVALIVVLLLPISAIAHRMNSAYTVVEVEKSGYVEITHRIFAHDIEHSFNLTDVGMDYFSSKEGQEALKTYLGRTFYITADNKQLALKYIGSEVDGDLVYSYFEAKIKPKTRNLTINSKILFEFQNDQNNYVNVHYEGNVKTLTFGLNSGDKTISLW
jgi:hypothetical protein